MFVYKQKYISRWCELDSTGAEIDPQFSSEEESSNSQDEEEDPPLPLELKALRSLIPLSEHLKPKAKIVKATSTF